MKVPSTPPPHDKRQQFDRRTQVLISAFLVAITFVAFWGLWGHEFVNYDDGEYVSLNPNIQDGVSFDAVKWAFTTGHAGNWHPLTWVSHMLDWQFYGSNAGSHHITSLLLHIVSTLLLLFALKKMTGSTWRSAFVAALFALHPLHVESVAWIAERKDVLSTFFLMLTLIFYVQYAQRQSRRAYLIALLLFAFGLMSKPMLVTVPFLLLLLDFWPLRRLTFPFDASPRKGQKGESDREKGQGKSVGRLLGEKVPFLLLTVASSIITVVAQRGEGAVVPTGHLPMHIRLENAALSYINYIVKMIWPSKLAVFYPHPGFTLPTVEVAGAILFLIAGSLVAVAMRRRHAYVTTGWFWYIGSLVPVIGIVQVGFQAMADRYTYIPLIGLFIVVAWGAASILSRFRFPKNIVIVAGGIVVLLLAVRTHSQVQVWQNSVTLWEHAIEVTTRNGVAHQSLAMALARQGKPSEAIAHYREALRTNPDFEESHADLASLLAREGQLEEAISHYKEAIRLKPDYEAVYQNLGMVLVQSGKTQEAYEYYAKALQLNPRNWRVHYNIGLLLAGEGKFEEATGRYKTALQIEPNSAEMHNRFGDLLVSLGRNEEAIGHYSQAVRINPNYAEARNSLGIALAKKGMVDEAITHFTKALELLPGDPGVKGNLERAQLLKKQNELTPARK